MNSVNNEAPRSMSPLHHVHSPPQSINSILSRANENSAVRTHDYEMSYPDGTSKKSRKRAHPHSTRSSRGESPSQYPSISSKSRLISPSDMSTDTDVVRIEAGDFLASYSTTNTVAALETCKTKIVYPFNMLLKFIGWRPIGYSTMDNPGLCVKLLNWLYISVIFSFVIFAYAYEMIACQWRLEIHFGMFTESPAIRLTTTSHFNTTESSVTASPMTTQMTTRATSPNISIVTSATPQKQGSMPVCEHLISTYIIPNTLHIIAYIIGFYHFRITACENIYALMEKVFQYCSTLVTQMAFQIHLIRKLRLYLALGFVWVLSSIVTNVLYSLAFAVNANDALALSLSTNRPILSYTFFAFDLVGALLISMVSMIVIYNYGVHCELVTFYADAICDKLQMRSIQLKVACSDMLNIRNAIRDINGAVGVMTTFILLVFSEMIFLGSCVLAMSVKQTPLNTIIVVYRTFFIIYLIPILFYPIIQAARVNNHCARFKRFSLEMRTFGYLNAAPEELDSFVLFTMSNRLSVSVLHVPINGAYLLVLTVAAFFLVLILFQLGVFGTHLII